MWLFYRLFIFEHLTEYSTIITQCPDSIQEQVFNTTVLKSLNQSLRLIINNYLQ